MTTAAWLPLGGVILSAGAFTAFLWLAWQHAPVGQKWHPRWGWAASWAIVAVVVFVFLTILGVWWGWRPRP